MLPILPMLPGRMGSMNFGTQRPRHIYIVYTRPTGQAVRVMVWLGLESWSTR